MEKIICGIQQMGIGVPNVPEIWAWYRKNFGIDVKVFEDAAEAPLMIKYTGNVVHKRTATLALSMNGGGGMEIWQFTSRPTNKAEFEIQAGDLGLYMCRIKSRNIEASHAFLSKSIGQKVSEIYTLPNNAKHFICEDPNGNLFDIVEGESFFTTTKHAAQTGGVAGAMIGVSNIEKSLEVYQNLLGYDEIVYDETKTWDDLAKLTGGTGNFRRVLLRHSTERVGPFSKLLGPSQIELIQSIDRTDVKKMFENRFWGDWGFIHLCFDVQGIEALKIESEALNYPFTVDSGSTFDMGEAGGRFSYIEDPDGTLIEFVETHKVPVLKKLGWYIDLKNRDPKKPLPTWMLKAMGLNRVK